MLNTILILPAPDLVVAWTLPKFVLKCIATKACYKSIRWYVHQTGSINKLYSVIVTSQYLAACTDELMSRAVQLCKPDVPTAPSSLASHYTHPDKDTTPLFFDTNNE